MTGRRHPFANPGPSLSNKAAHLDVNGTMVPTAVCDVSSRGCASFLLFATAFILELFAAFFATMALTGLGPLYDKRALFDAFHRFPLALRCTLWQPFTSRAVLR